jgi:hypothetical protein
MGATWFPSDRPSYFHVLEVKESHTSHNLDKTNYWSRRLDAMAFIFLTTVCIIANTEAFLNMADCYRNLVSCIYWWFYLILLKMLSSLKWHLVNSQGCLAETWCLRLQLYKITYSKKEDIYFSDKLVDFFKTMQTKGRRLFFTLTVTETVQTCI